MDYVSPDVLRYENALDQAAAVRFIRSHFPPMVRPLPHGEVEAWADCVGPTGCPYVEKHVFIPDLDGLIDLDEVRAWLGY